MNKPQLLMIINSFPPSGGSGVQRALKFLKYSCQEGWEVYVITPKKPTNTFIDYSLLKDIPPEAHIYKVGGLGIRTPEYAKITSTCFEETMPKNPIEREFWRLVKFFNDLFFPIDKQIGWVPFATHKAKQLIKKHNIKNVYITASPFSSFLAGIQLKKKFKNKIFWVADYRDSWQFAIYMKTKILPFRQRYIEKMDEKVLRSCDMAVFVTDPNRNEYLQKYPWLEPKSCTIINGYDEEDFKDVQPLKFSYPTLLYMGKADLLYGNLLNILPAISLSGIPNLHFIHIGIIDPFLLDEIKRKGYESYYYEGYKPHKEALNYLCGADVNLVIRQNDEESKNALSGKIFELLRAGRPILSVGPHNSAIANLVNETHTGVHAFIEDPEAIAEALRICYSRRNDSPLPKEVLEKYSREYLTKKLFSLYPEV